MHSMFDSWILVYISCYFLRIISNCCIFIFSIASLVWIFSHSWMMMKFLLWYVFWLSLSCSKCFSNKTCESFLKLWKLVCNQHFLFDVYTLHCCRPCFAQLFLNFMFKCFRFKSWPCCHWVKPRSTTCFFQFLIT